MAELVLGLWLEFSEGLVEAARDEERIITKAFSANFGFEDAAPALANEFHVHAIRSEDEQVAFEAGAPFVRWGFLHRLE